MGCLHSFWGRKVSAAQTTGGMGNVLLRRGVIAGNQRSAVAGACENARSLQLRTLKDLLTLLAGSFPSARICSLLIRHFHNTFDTIPLNLSIKLDGDFLTLNILSDIETQLLPY